MIPSNITLYASEIAACIGLNKYKSVEEMTKKVWCRYDPEGYRKASLRNDTTEPEPIENILQDLKLTEKVLKFVDHKNPNEMFGDIDNLSKLHKTELDANDISAADLASYIHTERGKAHEDISLERLQTALNVDIVKRNDKFYKRYIEYGPNKQYVIGGKVDGITADGYLVEVKNRQYRLFKEIPIYEKVQIHVYMFLTGIPECKFVQSFAGEDSSTDVEFDYTFWEMIKTKCNVFVRNVSLLASDEELQDIFLSTGNLSITDEDDVEK